MLGQLVKVTPFTVRIVLDCADGREVMKYKHNVKIVSKNNKKISCYYYCVVFFSVVVLGTLGLRNFVFFIFISIVDFISFSCRQISFIRVCSMLQHLRLGHTIGRYRSCSLRFWLHHTKAALISKLNINYITSSLKNKSAIQWRKIDI